MAAVTTHSNFGAHENKVCNCFHCFPIYLPWSDGAGCHGLHLLNVVLSQRFYTPLSPSSRGILISAIRVVSSAYLRLLILLLAILLPPCASSSPVFHIMYSAYELNKQGDNIQPWHTLFPNVEPVCCSMSGSNCCFLTWIQVSQETGKVVWYYLSL